MNMIRITQLKLSVDHSREELTKKIRKALRLKNEEFSYEIVKQSLDCRHKEDKKFVYTVDVSFCGNVQEEKIIQKVRILLDFTYILLYNISVVNYILTFFEKEGLLCIPYQSLWIRTGCQSWHLISSARLTLQKTCEIQQTLFFVTCVPD